MSGVMRGRGGCAPEEFGPRIAGAAKTGEPSATTTKNGGHHGDGFNVGDSGGAAKDTGIGWERGFEARLTRLALKALNQGGLLTTDVGAGTTVNIDVHVPARLGRVLAEQAGGVALGNSLLENVALVVKLTSNVDIA